MMSRDCFSNPSLFLFWVHSVFPRGVRLIFPKIPPACFPLASDYTVKEKSPFHDWICGGFKCEIPCRPVYLSTWFLLVVPFGKLWKLWELELAGGSGRWVGLETLRAQPACCCAVSLSEKCEHVISPPATTPRSHCCCPVLISKTTVNSTNHKAE